MLERIIKFLSSSKATILLLGIYAVMMAIATVVEKFEGTSVAKALIYYSPLFILLHILMVLNFVFLTIKNRLLIPQKWAYMLVHGAFVVILVGAMFTHLFSKEGMMQIREGDRTNEILLRGEEQPIVEHLPFEVELTDFVLKRYPGSQSPSSYESFLKIHVDDEVVETHIYMNHVLDMKGYRFFQASYDNDELGTILSVSYDVTGRRITYTGYVLLFIGLVGCFVSKHSRFRRLSRSLKVLVGGVMLLSGLSAEAQPYDYDKTHCEALGNLPMQSTEGRMIPVNTFSSEVMRKLKLKETHPEINADEFLVMLLTEPTRWANTPIIWLDDAELRKVYGFNKEAISYRDAFTIEGRYRYGEAVEAAYQTTPSLRSHLDRELLKLDEKVNLLHQIFNFQLLRIFPKSDDTITYKWVAAGDDLEGFSETDSATVVNLFRNYRNTLIQGRQMGNWQPAEEQLQEIIRYQTTHRAGLEVDYPQIEAEARYNRQDVLPHAKRGYLILGGILLVLTFLVWFKDEIPKWYRILKILLTVGILLCFTLHAVNMGMRWYISGHAPWTNTYETMIFLSWIAVMGGLFFLRRSTLTFALSVIFGGVVLFVASLNWMDPQITPLVPVLKSPWLMFHVATLMVAYGFMGISCMIGTTSLLAYAFLNQRNKSKIEHQISRLTIVNELSLMVGLALMIVGIFLGAVWANESWGRYWSWDPKETWALITAVIYALVLHLRWLEPRKNNLRFNFLSQWAFMAVLMTYFGVNYLLSGMHAYGNTSELRFLPVWAYILVMGFFVLPPLGAYLKKR